MRIIVATGLNAGAAEFKNMGDVAMLQVAVDRLLSFWPEAQVQVLTDSSSELARYCPRAKPLARSGGECWMEERIFLGRFHDYLPQWGKAQLNAFQRFVGRNWPKLLESAIRIRLGLRDKNGRLSHFLTFLEALRNADLLAVCGAGGFADSCQDWNLFVLDTMEVAIQRGIPVAMFGQGMGPLNDPVTLSRAKEVLPHVALLSLRGTRGGVTLLENIGFPRDKIMTASDEAVELAYHARENELGRAIGINLRVATYAEVSPDVVEQVGVVVRQFARHRNVALLPVPITFHEFAPDHQAIRRLLAGFDDETDGGLALDTPLKVVKQVARCRIVVTGAFHAAVFALAQGIPVVCLCNSAYYHAKFQGLEDRFGPGCAIVMLRGPDWPCRLTTAMETMWNSAEALRLPLLQSAARQIEESREAYRRVKNLLGSNQTQLALTDAAQTDRPESQPCRES